MTLARTRRGGLLATIAAIWAGAACSASNFRDGPNPVVDGGTPEASVGIDAPAVAQGDASIEASPNACVVADKQTDPRNCGACGHDCLEGACTAGACQPFAIVTTPQSKGARLTVHGGSVYWTSSSDATVKRCPVAGCAAPLAFATNEIVTGLSDGPSDVFLSVANANQIVRADPTTGLPTAFAKGQLSPARITHDRDNLYWVNQGKNDAGMSLGYAKTDGTGTVAIVLVPDAVTVLTGIAVNATQVYFSSGELIHGCPLPDCAGGVTTLANTTRGNFTLAADDRYVYWSAFFDNSIFRCAAGGCAKTPETMATGQSGAYGLLLDGKTLYWSNHYAGTVMSCPAASCSPSTLVPIASGQASPESIATDAKAIYWINLGKTSDAGGVSGGAIMKIAK